MTIDLDPPSFFVPRPGEAVDAFAARLQARQRQIQSLGDELTLLAGQINAGLARFVQVLGEFDAAEGWSGFGVQSLAHWLNFRCGIGAVAAREYVRVARALPELPLMTRAFAAGEVSYSKVRAMTRVATAHNEDYLLQIARHGTASHVARVVSAYRLVRPSWEEAEAAALSHERRGLTMRPDEHDPTVVRLLGELSAEGAAVVEQALSALMEEAHREAKAKLEQEMTAPETQQAEPSAGSPESEDVTAVTGPRARLPGDEWARRVRQSRADALVRMAELALSGLDRASSSAPIEVRLHVDAGVLHGRGPASLEDAPEGGHCTLEAGDNRHFPLPAETARRLSCDAARVIVVTRHGEPLSIGRKSRTVPPAIQRALAVRDGHCRFPGCDRTAGLQAHHIRHWSQGGETALDNLVTLCKTHHRLVHEERFSVSYLGRAQFAFTRPDGEVLDRAPRLRTAHWMDLVRRHRHAGIAIDKHTAIPQWDGGSMDLSVALNALLHSDGLA